MTFDITKPYRCRNGAEAKVVEGGNGWFYGCYTIESPLGPSVVSGIWLGNGIAFNPIDHGYDLINIPQKRKLDVWMNVFERDGHIWTAIHESLESAAMNLEGGYQGRKIACLRIAREYEEGEGL